MKECEWCFEEKDKEDFSLSYELRDRELLGVCNECVQSLSIPADPRSEGLTWSREVRRYHLHRKEDPYWKEKYSQYSRDWAERNPDKISEISNRRRLAKLDRTCFGYEDEISSIYRECRKISLETGIEHHVDHIIPLQGEHVSGLHVPWNLQIITAHENLSKKNKFTPYVEYYKEM